MRDEDVKKYASMEAPELRLRCAILDTENNILRAQLDSTRRERNQLLRKVADVDFGEPRPQLPNGLPPVPRPIPRQ